MTIDFATAVGLIGSALMVIAFAYSNIAKVMNLITFNLLNLVGSLMLGASLLVHFNLASLLLEMVWAVIALVGLIKALMTRARA